MTALLTATAIVAAVAGYFAACTFWPFAKCPGCDGTGRKMSPSGKHWREHRRCKGTGRRLRLGRRVFNFFHTAHRDAAR